ncbi:NAD-dependent epimerase/dehydratase family protein [Reyranella sp.]|jgi:UDP-glucuronate 4-epimerase|uniref:NAD-dependent epimerase/dehydratase family protein n=1 Tax=Reyranella sp. TaxID=1929291 RepID=UPI000BCCE73F|nr:NAD-dependent epimerase/dehydratase family protein [Reyranella sp.]OYY42096.1 MAG: protein CapI [Rhodospirillales bacterium 35-66-84]OYZ93877.1 MAG: protein CapI [Rhodospirillales bacterium 24-66-33]OZB25127.1 MAG: protein CapI [Rhodospirillales bacterium 39-66-50]HQS17989.1 NAD-dependent epimerase/dehydratase family protein [Reyranella sp.]HQT10574.1 NAD-dependent epimerase/dehydratase family protein [Reyranella sp.]
MTSVLVTGVAGFVGSYVARALLARGERVLGIDNFSDYYDPVLKFARLKPLRETAGFTFIEGDISDRQTMMALADRHEGVDRIVHLAAQPGIRHSQIDPYIYVQTNVMGHLVVLELARRLGSRLRHLVYASSSSVYGGNDKIPFAVGDRVDHPVSLYAATKRSGELMTETYVHQYGLKATGLRYFTVYGPWGRPDMSPYIFARAIHEGRTIPLYHHGKLKRDFTYIDDIAAGTLVALDLPPATAGHRLYNLGGSRSEEILDVIALFEKALGRKAVIELKPGEPGDMPETAADIDATTRDFGWTPKVTVDQGIPLFVDWFKEYNRL